MTLEERWELDDLPTITPPKNKNKIKN